MEKNYTYIFRSIIEEGIKLRQIIKNDEANIVKVGEEIAKSIDEGNKVLICGNGGSAADAQHFAAELIGRFEQERKAFPAVALTTDTSILTAVANDYGYETIFKRQVEGLGIKDDFFIGISTSGNSANVMKAVEKAHELNMKTVSLTGKDGGKLKALTHFNIHVPGDNTARVQEGHITILHILADIIERELI